MRIPGTVIKKGTRLDPERIATLKQSGIRKVTGARLDAEDVDENTAAGLLAQVLAGEGVVIGKPATGRCNLYAVHHGLTQVNANCIDAINLCGGQVTIATLPNYGQAYEDQAVATVKVIPFGLDREAFIKCVELAGETSGAINCRPLRHHHAALILTSSNGTKASVLASTLEVTRERLEALGSHIAFHQCCGHSVADVSAALRQALQQGCDPILLCGASVTVDENDIIPQAMLSCGIELEHFGMPVEPGNMLLLGRVAGRTVINLPGCSRSPKLNGLDWVLERTLADILVSADEIMRMGVGGLIKDRAHVQRRQSDRARHLKKKKSRIAGVILAAGRSVRSLAAFRI